MISRLFQAKSVRPLGCVVFLILWSALAWHYIPATGQPGLGTVHEWVDQPYGFRIAVPVVNSGLYADKPAQQIIILQR